MESVWKHEADEEGSFKRQLVPCCVSSLSHMEKAYSCVLVNMPMVPFVLFYCNLITVCVMNPN